MSLLTPEDRLSRILIRVDSHNRMEKFLEIADTLEDKLYWIGLKYAYCNSDNTYRYKERLKVLFSSDRDNRECLMNDQERNFLDNLQDNVTVYRAMTYQEFESGKYGISWTLDKTVAYFFKDEYKRNNSTAHLDKLVYKQTVSKDLIIAYWNEREEDEIIIVFPD